MVREILDATNPKLREKSKPVKNIDKKVLSIIADLKETLAHQFDPEGIGLAAPQIGKNMRIFVLKPAGVMKTIINPEIISVKRLKSKKEGKKKIMEGCLSLPHYYGPIRRAQVVKIKYLNEKGDEVSEDFEEIDAQIVLHEIDHLNGTLFIDRLLEQKKPLYEYINGEWEEVEI